ncbi:MAG TPA: DAK2 domain-containing protein [Ktedonobacteraceae bacterium]|nr:DAK2 domain-containing protein [Ktedonobacteraceae bacterium]
MRTQLTIDDIRSGLTAMANALISQADELNKLDAAMGDGDTGVTIRIGATAVLHELSLYKEGDLATLLTRVGMSFNRAAPSTIGGLIATAGMRAGKRSKELGATTVTLPVLVALVAAMEQGISERGKARLGDKTLLDALIPAREALEQASAEGIEDIEAAGHRALAAAIAGRDTTAALQSRVGRASWVGTRTIGQVDPGAEIVVIAIHAATGADHP